MNTTDPRTPPWADELHERWAVLGMSDHRCVRCGLPLSECVHAPFAGRPVPDEPLPQLFAEAQQEPPAGHDVGCAWASGIACDCNDPS